MTNFVLALFQWNRKESDIEALEAFFSTTEGAPIESSARKLRHVDLITDRISALFLESSDSLEKQIDEGFFQVTWGHSHFEDLNNLLDPELFAKEGAASYEFRRTSDQRWHVEVLNLRYLWRIIQRMPKVQELLMKKISEAKRTA